MKKIMIIWVIAALLVVIAIATTQSFNEKGAGNTTKSGSETTTSVNNTNPVSPSNGEKAKAAPDFTLKDLSGNTVKLSDLKGKKVYVNFWATWCGYCVEEMPDIQKIADENPDIVVLAVNVAESEKDVKAFMAEKKLKLQVLMDNDGKVSSETYGVTGYPTSVFINSDGTIQNIVEGMMAYKDMKAEIEKLK